MQLTSSHSWRALEQHANTFRFLTSADLITNHTSDSNEHFLASACGIQLDYSNQRITNKTLSLLMNLAEERHLKTKIEALFQGDTVNLSEKRPALHSALRAPADHAIFVENKNIMPDVISARQSMEQIAEQIRAKKWLGSTGKQITDIINIGIGGSDLGPRFCVNALSDLMTNDLNLHFISDADPASFLQTINNLNPETTLFIISSKSFTTQETLYNAKKAIAWLGDKQTIPQHIIAITANREKAIQLGIQTIIPIWSWVGGRYSLCSAISLITAISIGFNNFEQLLRGAHDMDQHFQHSDFSNNLPVLLALLGIWNNNFLHISNLLFLIYSKQLELLVPHLQQLDMESNGKSLDNRGRAVNYRTGPIVWGGLGNQAQHSYYQLLYQGTHKITTDFISVRKNDGQIINDLCKLKMKLLVEGSGSNQNNHDNFIPGNMPLNHLQLDSCSPYTIGALTALYEHKIFVQSVIWDINPFDQPGVTDTKQKFLSTVG